MKWVVLIFWLFVSSGYLYFLNFAIPKEASFKGYFLFTVTLAGGGLSYDIASKIFSIPGYKNHWPELIKRMALVLIGHCLVLAGIFAAGYLSNLYNPYISFGAGILISAIGIILACYHAYKAEYTFKKLRRMFA
ncbi:hypothetical protein [Pseudomonas sp.]|uniref:hypothetical protein n=1 Tax=Pseudomonas sp. TaxID=306 RepID=UPI00289CBD1E|nr:hypothetical protein [Pseudomonas sp.]